MFIDGTPRCDLRWTSPLIIIIRPIIIIIMLWFVIVLVLDCRMKEKPHPIA